MSSETPTWDTIIGDLGSTTTELGGSWGNMISNYYNGVNIALVDASKLPIIGTLTRYKFEKLGLFDVDQSHHIVISADDIDTGPTRKIRIRRMNTPFEEDFAVLEGMPQSILNKTIDSDLNAITNIVNADIKAAAGIQYSKLNLIGSIVNNDISGSAAIATTKLADSGNFLLSTQNNSLGAHSLTFTKMTAPSSPGANDLVLYTDTADTHLKVKNSAGTVTDISAAASSSVTTLDSLTDVNAPTPTNNHVLTFNSGTGQWISAAAPGASGGEANTLTNVGSGSQVAKAKVGVNYDVRTFTAGAGGKITVTQNTDDIQYQVVDGSTTQKGAVEIATDGESSGSVVVAGNDSRLVAKSFLGSTPYLYTIFIDTADSNKYKAINHSTNVVTDSGSSTDVLSLFNTVIAAASTAGRPIRMDKGMYLFSAAPTIGGKYIHITGTRTGYGTGGGQGDPTKETVLKKAYTDNTNAFLNWDGSTTWSRQQWEDLTLEGKDSTNNGAGTFDNGGIGFQIKSAVGPSPPAISEVYDCFRNVIISHFGTGLKLMKCYQLTFHDLGIYKCGSKGIHLTDDGTSGQCFEIVFRGGEVRFTPTNVHIEKANHTKFDQMMLEGDSTSPYTLVNSVNIGTSSTNTRIDKCSFENNVNGITTILDAGIGTVVDACRFGGLTWTAQTVYGVPTTSTAQKGNFINNIIEPYTNNAVATISLGSGSRHYNIIGNHGGVVATNTTLTITDNSGNSTTNNIFGNTSGDTLIDNSIGRTTKFLSPNSVQTISLNPFSVYNSDFTGNGLFSAVGITLDLPSNNASSAVKKSYARIYATADDNTNGAEYSWVGIEYILAGVNTTRAMFYNNGIVVGPSGQRLRIESANQTADRTFSAPDKNGVLTINTPTYNRKGATANRRYVAGLRQYSDTALLTSTTTPAVNTLWAMPLLVTQPTKFDTITCQVTTLGSGSNVRMGIYADDGTGAYPGALIFDSGSISSATTGAKEVTITAGVQLFQPGIYWVAWECSATAPQIRILPGAGNYLAFGGYDSTLSTTAPQFAWSVAHTLGALPNPYTASATAITTASSATTPIPAVGLRPIT